METYTKIIAAIITANWVILVVQMGKIPLFKYQFVTEQNGKRSTGGGGALVHNQHEFIGTINKKYSAQVVKKFNSQGR